MIRQVIEIDDDKCTGCGICANACQEGAIEIVDGKARLMRDDYCDGLGNCLPACPEGAIAFVEREAAEYDEAAVAQHLAAQHVCPGAAERTINRGPQADTTRSAARCEGLSELGNWPVQIKLAPVHASCFDGANLLVAADCAAYSHGNFHADFMRNRTVLIGCPKLDGVDYTDKLTQILAGNNVKSLTVVRMEVPCCGGLAHAATEALKASGKFIPWQVVTIGIDGNVLE